MRMLTQGRREAHTHQTPSSLQERKHSMMLPKQVQLTRGSRGSNTIHMVAYGLVAQMICSARNKLRPKSLYIHYHESLQPPTWHECCNLQLISTDALTLTPRCHPHSLKLGPQGNWAQITLVPSFCLGPLKLA